MNRLIDILKCDFEEMQLEMERCSSEGHGSPQDIADRRESLVRTFFEKYYPFPYRITKGQISDSYGKSSCSVDCVILNPIHPNTIDSKTSLSSVILADGVDFAIECKSNLNSNSEIYRALKQCITVKELRKVSTGVWGAQPKDFNYQIPYIIWSNKTCYSIDSLLEKIVNYYEENNIKQINQFDLLVVDGKFIIFNIGINNLGGNKNHKKGLYYSFCEKDTLACLLWSMSNFIGAAPSIKNILSKYTLIEKELFSIQHLNERLNKL